MEIKKLFTNYNHNKGDASRIKYIVIHYVGATGGAEANCRYYAGGNMGASAHYFVDFNGEVWQSVEDKNVAWHCGASRYKHPECRNANSIGIELCVRNKGSQAADSRDWFFEDATVKSAIELAKALMQKYKIPASHVVRHYDVTGKICPNPYVYNHTKHTWAEFKNALEEVDAPPKKPSRTVTSKSSREDVLWLQQKANLVIARTGLKDADGRRLAALKEDGVYGKKSKEFVKALWNLLGWKNNDAVGNAGGKTIAFLDNWRQ